MTLRTEIEAMIAEKVKEMEYKLEAQHVEMMISAARGVGSVMQMPIMSDEDTLWCRVEKIAAGRTLIPIEELSVFAAEGYAHPCEWRIPNWLWNPYKRGLEWEGPTPTLAAVVQIQKKKVPEVPVEVHRVLGFDPEKAHQAMIDLCRGQ